ncbi:hypothetical protein [Hyphomicrobium sp. 99]|uniref:hypothetical protein n=1 Tax=Hyphomicrobium sp. 99 TaxID=1163419 RepID=UPI0005F862CE|nr:hypothetical protein [Hyphomicrobium sp. 99]
MTASRLRIRFVWLTLFAFSVQFCVASFHHHASREVGARSIVAFAGHCTQTPTKPCAPSGDDHHGCVLCWATAVAATSLVPSLFDFPAPTEVAFVHLQAPLNAQSSIVRCYELRARGPPQAQFA